MFLFFFQAEDGIRDADVTGVQTCALPISTGSIWENSYNGGHKPDSVHSLQTLVAHLQCFPPLFTLRLPPELQSCIWKHVGLASCYSAFIIMACETSRLARCLHCPVSRDVVLEQ